MKCIRFLLSTAGLTAVLSSAAFAGTWTQIKNPPNFGFGAGAHYLLTDGSVLCQDADSNDWAKLTPDKNGSYVNGTWSAVANMPSNYGPLWYAAAVLPSGNVFTMGGEYNLGGPGVWTNLGAMYNPVSNTWSAITPPDGGSGIWSSIGDSQCVILPDGKLLLANFAGTSMAAFNEQSLSFSDVTASGKADRFDEEGWTLLPDGSILTVDAINSPGTERYIPSGDLTGQWISAGKTPNSLEDSNTQEIGPMVLRHSGTVFATGATKFTAIYTPPKSANDPGTWVAGPNFPVVGGQQLDIADGPSCLLPSDNVLVAASPGVFNAGTNFFEFDGKNFIAEPNIPNAPFDSSFQITLLMLPNGQVMATDLQSNDVEFYTPTGTPKDSWRPTITKVNQNLVAGSKNNVLQGTQLNGLSQCVAYGDDEQAATNYPIVRIVNKATGHTFYCRTHNHSTMAVATGAKIVSTLYDIPVLIDPGPSSIEVVANGISSSGIKITATSIVPISIVKLEGGATTGKLSDAFYFDALSFGIGSAFENPVGQVASGIVTFSPPVTSSVVTSAQISYILAAAVGVTNTVFIWNPKANRWDFFGKQVMTSAFSTGTITLSQSQYATYLGANNQLKVLIRDISPQHVTNNPPPFTLLINEVQLAR